MVARIALVLIVSLLFLISPAWAQQPNAAVLQRVRVSLRSSEPPLLLGSIPLLVSSPESLRRGIFTLVPPDAPGEMIRVTVPVGELVSRAVRAIGRAQYRRAEQRAHTEVVRALSDFKAQQIKAGADMCIAASWVPSRSG